MSSAPAAVPVAVLTIVGALVAVLGLFGGGISVIALGLLALVAAAFAGALATGRR